MGPRGFWVALAIVLFYLIARPHIGTVWHLETDPLSPEHGLTLDQVKALPSGLTPIRPPTTRFTDKRDCFNAQMRFERVSNSTVYCASTNALLWGW